MKAAIYVRVSGTKKKLDGERRQDVNRQIEVIEKYLKRAGIKEWKVYCDDGKSAFTEDINSRPAFKQLLNEDMSLLQKLLVSNTTQLLF